MEKNKEWEAISLKNLEELALIANNNGKPTQKWSLEDMVRGVYSELIKKYVTEGKDYSRLIKRLEYLRIDQWTRTIGGKSSAS